MKTNNKNFKFKHSLGQNFIIDEFLLEDIADESKITKDDFVLEIGPGNGALTRCLCDRARHVVAVEIDKSLIPLLKSNLKEYENITIINADFIELDFQTILDEFSNVGDDILSSQVGANANYMDEHCKSNEDRRGEHCEPVFHIKVVANLPYYITSPIINILLQNPYISEMTLMVQKEVAERIVATPGGRDYGILTLACNYFADTEMIMVVSKDCFFPKPKVDSAVVHFKKHLTAGPASVGAKLASALFKLIKASFAQRRKKLLNSLTNAGYDKNIVSNALLELGFDENVRAENLSLDDYKRLLTFFHNL